MVPEVRLRVLVLVLAGRVAGLVVLGAMSVAYLTYAVSLVVAREDGMLRRWRATPLLSWGYFAGRIVAAGCLLVTATIGGVALAAAGTAITPLLSSAQGATSWSR